jgi:plastocyanin
MRTLVPGQRRNQLFRKISLYLLLIGAALLILFIPIPQKMTAPVDRYFEINASTFQFVPGDLTVNPGDRVTIKLISHDVVHGLALDSSTFELKAEPGQPAVGTFIAEQPGVFRFRCTVTCGNLHPFMLGKLRVGSNLLLIRGVALAIFASLIGLFSLSNYQTRPQAVP